jgi:hypothetical protein
LVRSPATPDEDKKQNVKKPQKRTKFVLGVSWIARRPPRIKTKSKTSKSLKIVQSSFWGFLGSLAGHPRMKTKCKTSKSLKIVQSSFLGFLGSLDGHPGSRQNAKLQKGSRLYKVRFWGFLVRSPATPDQDKKQNFKKGQNRTKFVIGVSWFARRPPRMKTKCKTSKRLKIVQCLFLGFFGSLAGHTPEQEKIQNFKKAQNRTKFDFRFSWFPRRPHPDQDKMQNVKKAQKRTKFVFGVSWMARRPPRMKTKCKTSKRLKIVQSSFYGFLGSLDGHPG